MYTEWLSALNKQKIGLWKEFLSAFGLIPDPSADKTVLILDGGEIIASASRKDNVIKCIAASEKRQGEGLTATLITELRKDALNDGISHLFLYTKPENEEIFSSLFFYPIAKTDKVLLMENKKSGISEFLSDLPGEKRSGVIGSAVMNCNPFTLGHRYLIETASRECDHVYLFAVSEDKSEFSYKDRLEMIARGISDLKNVTLLPTGPYLVSSASFPDYFLKDRDSIEEVHCHLDVEIFTKYYVPKFSITRRYVGTEPLSPATEQYNAAMRAALPEHGVELVELKRLENENMPISASEARRLILNGEVDRLKAILPETTIEYLNEIHSDHTGE